MENRLCHLFLALALLITASPALAASDDEQTGLIQPTVERNQFDEATIDSNDFEIILSAGYLSIEDFAVNSMLGVKLNYYVTDSLFVQLDWLQATAGDTSYEILSGGAPLLTDEERELTAYAINLGYNLLPGEVFFSEHTTFNSAFFINAGIGNATFAGNDRFSYNYGAGFRVLLLENLSLYSEFRNHVFDVDVFGINKTTNNLQFSIAVGWYF